MNINFTSAQCLKKTSAWGADVIHNICSGSQHVIPWGGVDYMSGVFNVVFSALVIAVGVGIAIWALGSAFNAIRSY